MKVTKLGGSYAVIIPKAIVEYILKWKEGDELDLEIVEKNGKKAILIFKRE